MDSDVWKKIKAKRTPEIERLIDEIERLRNDLAHMTSIGARHSSCKDCERIRAEVAGR